jgi:hypothetical protein
METLIAVWRLAGNEEYRSRRSQKIRTLDPAGIGTKRPEGGWSVDFSGRIWRGFQTHSSSLVLLFVG